MVKVISAYNFQEQNTYSSTGDIAAICLVGSCRLAIAHRNHLIEIVTLKNRKGSQQPASTNYQFIDQNENNCRPNKIAFPTIDQVEQLHYCAAGNYLLAIEEKSSENDYDATNRQRYIRAYTNFDIVNSENCFSIPIRARIASKTTPNVICDDHIEVIEIPLPAGEIPNLITCCQMSGTIAISCDFKLFFYEFRRRTSETNKFQFIDFFEFPFFVELEFRPLKFEIAEHVIVCLDRQTAIAFKIVDLSDINTEDGTTSNSMATDSSMNQNHHSNQPHRNDHHSNYRQSEPIDFEVAKQFNQANGIKFQTDIRSICDHDNDRGRSLFSEDRPILVNDVKVLLKYTTDGVGHNDRVFYSIRSLVQLRLHKQKSSNYGTTDRQNTTSIHDEFRCLALKPIYYRSQSIVGRNAEEDHHHHQQHRHQNHRNFIDMMFDKCPCSHLMKSNFYGNCVGFSLFITTVSDGYMYQFTNQGKWYTENTKCLAIYPFTAPVIDIVIDNFVIHAITECGIETFSSRIGHKLFSSYFEYPMMSDPYPNETSPLVDVPICVMGICGFFGIKFVTASNHNLILLTTVSDLNGGSSVVSSSRRSRNESLDWTIYDLKFPKPEILVDDIESLAGIYRTTSPEIYYELMEEAHIIIRLARELMMIPIITKSSVDFDDANDSDDEVLKKSFMNTCMMLADFTIQSSRKEIYSQAAAYYTMCNHSIPEIYTKYFDSNLTKVNENPIGLIYTLKLILSRIGSVKSQGEYLTQTIAMNRRNSRGATATTTTDHNFAEEFFQLFVNHSCGDLASIALSSSVFREILSNQFYRLYNDDGRILTGEEKLCLILCLCQRNEINRARQIFEKCQRIEIFVVLRDYWPTILFDNFQSDNYRKSTFSEITESVLFVSDNSELIDAIADSFIRILIQTRSIDLEFVLKLFMNYFAINVGQKGYRTSQRILEIILQAYFNDFYSLNDQNGICLISTVDGGKLGGGGGSINENLSSATPNSSDLLQSRLSLSGGAAGLATKTLLFDQNQNNSLQLSEDSSTNTTVDSNYEDPEFEAMKILFRMYLGLLKFYSNETADAVASILPDVNGYRLAFIDYMYRNVALIKSTNSKLDRNCSANSNSLGGAASPLLPDYDNNSKTMPFRRPIVFFERREMFLNKMEPLSRPGCFQLDTDGVLYFDDWSNELSLVSIKIQALLSSGKLDGSLISDFITFVHSNPNVIGIDSLLTILLPKSEGVELLIHANPCYLLDYAKDRLTAPNQWQVLFKRILIKKRELKPETQQDIIELYDRIIDDILRNLVSIKTLDDFLSCIPEQEINRNDYPMDKDNSYWKIGKYRTATQDGIDETNPFEMIMREAVAKQRSDALCAMIQSSGRQLNDAVNNYQLNFN